MYAGGSLRPQSVERVLRGVEVGDQVVHRIRAGHLEESRGAKLAVIGEQHDALGRVNYGPFDLRYFEASLGEQRTRYSVDADEGDVDVQTFEKGSGV